VEPTVDGVLLDGNIGIGGDPVLLLCRVRDLLAPHGKVLIAPDRSGSSERCTPGGTAFAVLRPGRREVA
jgi:hypothetical protein